MVQTNYVLCVWQPALVFGMYLHHREEIYGSTHRPNQSRDRQRHPVYTGPSEMRKPTGPAKGDLPCSNRGCALGHHHTPLAGHSLMRSPGTTISSNHWRGSSATPDNTGWRSSHYTRIPTLGRALSAGNGKYRINGTLLPRNAHCHTQPRLEDGP